MTKDNFQNNLFARILELTIVFYNVMRLLSSLAVKDLDMLSKFHFQIWLCHLVAMNLFSCGMFQKGAFETFNIPQVPHCFIPV